VIDVVIPVYRGNHETRRCFDGVLSTVAHERFEVVVVDDVSPEPEIVGYLDELARGRRITLLRNETNVGFVGSVNRAMALHRDRDVVPAKLPAPAADVQHAERGRPVVIRRLRQRDRLSHQKVIDVRSQPVGVGELVARAGGHEQLVRSVRRRSIRPALFVLEIRKPALQPADDVGVRALPGAVGRERPEPRQIVSIGELFDDDASQRRRRLTDRESRVPAALQQNHAQPETSCDHRQDGAAEARPDDGEIAVNHENAKCRMQNAECKREVAELSQLSLFEQEVGRPGVFRLCFS